MSTNLGNIPKRQTARDPKYEVRQIIIPRKGCALVEADLSQAEARVVAAACGDRELLQRWQDDPTFDIHRHTASIAFACPTPEITKPQRDYIGKPTRHAAGYGMTWPRYMQAINDEADVTGYAVNKTEAQTYLKRVQSGMAGLEEWWQRVNESVDKPGYLTTCFGRRRFFHGRRRAPYWLDDVHKEAIAYEPQSTIADLLNRGLLRWWKQCDKAIAPVVMQIHDAIVVEAKLERVKAAARMLKRCLTEEIHVNNIALTVPVDVSFSSVSWAKMEEMEL